MGGGLESRCVARVYGVDGAVYGSQDHQKFGAENHMLQVNI